MAALLTTEELDAALAALPSWSVREGALERTWVRPSFPEAIERIVDIGRLAEERGHHPDVSLSYRQLTLRLVTHDSGGLTLLDVDLAKALDRLLG